MRTARFQSHKRFGGVICHSQAHCAGARIREIMSFEAQAAVSADQHQDAVRAGAARATRGSWQIVLNSKPEPRAAFNQLVTRTIEQHLVLTAISSPYGVGPETNAHAGLTCCGARTPQTAKFFRRARAPAPRQRQSKA